MPRSKKKSTKSRSSSSKSRSTKPSKTDDDDSNDSECSEDESDDEEKRKDDWQSWSNEDDDQIKKQRTRGSRGRAYLTGRGHGRTLLNINCDCLTGNSRHPVMPPCGCCESKTDFSCCCPTERQEDQNDEQNRPRPLCYPLTCPPNPNWEREIVKYNPAGKWDPKIEEKGESGHPNLKGSKNKNNNNQNNNNNKGKTKKEDKKSVYIGEPCNAYRCYKDPSLPCGLAYCTPKHLKKPQLPPCPQKFPIKPRRIMICPPGQDENEDDEREDETKNNFCNCCQNRQQQQPHQPQFPQFPEFPPFFGQTAPAPRQKIPDEWIQLLPVCDDKLPPNLPKSGSGGQKKGKRK